MSLHPRARVHLAKWLLLFAVLALVVVAVVKWRDHHYFVSTSQTSSSGLSQTVSSTPSFNKQLYSTGDPASLWVVVNKGRVLAISYVPANLVAPKIRLSSSSTDENMHLRSDAATALEKLVAAAASAGVKLVLVSGYRSFATQQTVYNGYVSSQSKAYADATSARPGHSEHQTGLAADLGATSGKCQLDPCFGDTPEGRWLAANAYKYGFIIRYQKDKTSLTGYVYEPWHIRYVGSELATQLNQASQTLEQFFNLPSYADYPAQSYELKTGL